MELVTSAISPQTAWFLQKIANLKAHYDKWLARYYCRRNWHFVQTQSKTYWNSHSNNNTKPRSSMNFYIFCSWWQTFTGDTWGFHKDWESLYSNELQNFSTLSTLWTALIYMVTYILLRYFMSWTSGRNSGQSSVMTD